jgi:hypothetical protein
LKNSKSDWRTGQAGHNLPLGASFHSFLLSPLDKQPATHFEEALSQKPRMVPTVVNAKFLVAASAELTVLRNALGDAPSLSEVALAFARSRTRANKPAATVNKKTTIERTSIG